MVTCAEKCSHVISAAGLTVACCTNNRILHGVWVAAGCRRDTEQGAAPQLFILAVTVITSRHPSLETRLYLGTTGQQPGLHCSYTGHIGIIRTVEVINNCNYYKQLDIW